MERDAVGFVATLQKSKNEHHRILQGYPSEGQPWVFVAVFFVLHHICDFKFLHEC